MNIRNPFRAVGSHPVMRASLAFSAMAVLFLLVGAGQSWALALTLLNLCLISALMALGLNMQWGYAGLFNAGVMGFVALGGLATVLISQPPVVEAWRAGAPGLAVCLALLALIVGLVYGLRKLVPPGGLRWILTAVILIVGVLALRYFYLPATQAIEAINPAKTGFLGGLGLPVLLAWAVGGLFAAGAAWLISKIALGLRSDYLAIATLGIAEIIISVLKNEDWLTRGVKNVTGLKRPVPYEIDLQEDPGFVGWVERLASGGLKGLEGEAYQEALQPLIIQASSLFVKAGYSLLFLAVVLLVLLLAQRALYSPWGRMMRAIRDNEVAAAAMGKNVVFRHRQIFVLGSAVLGISGAMLATLDGQFLPPIYHPLRFTFLIWVMVILGGSGNNLGAVLGGFLVWFLWVETEPASQWIISLLVSEGGILENYRSHLLQTAPYWRLFLLGVILLVVMRFYPRGLLPEQPTGRVRRSGG